MHLTLALILAAAAFPVDVIVAAADAPPRFAAIVNGSFVEALNGDDVFALERHVGDAAGLIQQVGDAVDAVARQGCTLTPEQANRQRDVGERVLAAALLEAAKGRAGAAIALVVASDFTLALDRCLPFGVAASQVSELAQHTLQLTQYLRSHDALDGRDAARIGRSLERLAPAQAALLARPAPSAGALVLVPASIRCRTTTDGRRVLSASEARDIGRRYQDRPPTFAPVFGPRGIEGLQIVTDAFLQSCGFEDGDVVRRINGVAADAPERMMRIADRVGQDRRAVIVVSRGGVARDVVIEEG